MVFFNYSTMQMAAKIVYYGPGLAGKTTNLHYIYSHTASESRGEMVSLETETDRTLFFDLHHGGTVAGFNARIQLYTVPGQVFYNTTRKLVLKGVDGIVFVADSQRPMKQANIDLFKNLEENLVEMGLSLDTVALVFQYNKRDLPNICSVEEMNQALNRNNWPWIEASAITGRGVFETLKKVSDDTVLALKKRLARPQATAAASTVPRPTSQPPKLVLEASPAAPPPQLESGPTVTPGKVSGGNRQGARNYDLEIDKLAQTVLGRKAAAPPSVSRAQPSSANGGVFISYRRSDSMDIVGRMYDRLVAYYGRDRVFVDVDSIPVGVNFRKHIENGVAQASVFVVVIGRSWLRSNEEVAGAQPGNALLVDPDDFVRIEVEMALRLNLPVIPVLVRGAKMPSRKELPESLVSLVEWNGMEVRSGPDFHKDMDRLIAGMDTLLRLPLKGSA